VRTLTGYIITLARQEAFALNAQAVPTAKSAACSSSSPCLRGEVRSPKASSLDFGGGGESTVDFCASAMGVSRLLFFEMTTKISNRNTPNYGYSEFSSANLLLPKPCWLAADVDFEISGQILLVICFILRTVVCMQRSGTFVLKQIFNAFPITKFCFQQMNLYMGRSITTTSKWKKLLRTSQTIVW